MKVLNLRCAHSHSFEGWFASHADYEDQRGTHRIECPMCGNTEISKLPSAPRLNLSAAAAASNEVAVTQEAAWMKAVQHVVANTEDVGDKFAEEARRMHYREIDERAIRGQASADDVQALNEEGIAVMQLPTSVARKGPLQ